eukprot:Seg3988.1 transcript_id=Seg3988.1/GoldUCD/mRNA.D3Y31 product="hypothetical protein" protein_id=Seg3988.1/GoldUCD/D3Y31
MNKIKAISRKDGTENSKETAAFLNSHPDTKRGPVRTLSTIACRVFVAEERAKRAFKPTLLLNKHDSRSEGDLRKMVEKTYAIKKTATSPFCDSPGEECWTSSGNSLTSNFSFSELDLTLCPRQSPTTSPVLLAPKQTPYLYPAPVPVFPMEASFPPVEL